MEGLAHFLVEYSFALIKHTSRSVLPYTLLVQP